MKRKLCESSESCSKSELQIFDVPPTQTSIENGTFDTILPEEGSLTNNMIEFKINGDSLNYLDLGTMEIYAEVELKPTVAIDGGKNNDPVTVNNTMIYPANNFLHSLFESATVRWNDEIVEQTSEYCYKAYIEDTLNYDSELKNTYLQQQCYYKDDAGQFDNLQQTYYPGQPQFQFIWPEKSPWEVPPTGTKLNLTYNYNNHAADTAVKLNERVFVVPPLAASTPRNEGAHKRRNYQKDVKLMKGQLHLDTCYLSGLILPGITVRISLKKNTDKHCLMYDSDSQLCKIDWKRIFLKVRRVTVSPSEMYNHQLALQAETSKLFYKKNIVKTLNMNYNQTLTTIQIHEGNLPNRVILGFMETDTKAGTYKTNPYKFEHFDMENINLKVSSKNVVFTDGLKMKMTEKDVLEAYNTLYSGISPCSKDITINEYMQGYYFVAFDLTPDLCSGPNFNNLKDGKLECSMKFETKAAKAISMIAYLEFDNKIEISATKKITCNYQ